VTLASRLPTQSSKGNIDIPLQGQRGLERLGKDQRTNSVLCFRMENILSNIWRMKKIRTSQSKAVIDAFVSEP
jgi:hypothetical protein